MQAGDDAAAAAAADTVATQNLLASIAGILQNTTAAVPPGPPSSTPLGTAPLSGPGGSPTQNRTNSNGGGNSNAQGVGLSPGLILLPAGLPFLNAPGLQNLAPYLQLLPGLGTGDGSMPFGLPQLGLDGQLNQLNLAALLGGTGLDIDMQGADLSSLDPTRKGGMSGSKRPADGSAGAPYKRERSEEGRSREVSGMAVRLSEMRHSIVLILLQPRCANDVVITAVIQSPLRNTLLSWRNLGF